MTTNNIILETPRLLLREVIIDDAPFFYELNSNPLVIQYTGDKAFKDLEVAENLVRFLQKQYEENRYARLTVIEKSTQTTIGWCGLKYHTDTQETDTDWRDIPGEVQAWEALQSSLDVFVQRISVSDAGKRAGMRAWYESLQDIGGSYYGNSFSMQ